MKDFLTTYRDPARIPRILEKIQVLWETYPDQRLGQLLVNFGIGRTDHPVETAHTFFYEDNLLEDSLDAYLQIEKDNCRER